MKQTKLESLLEANANVAIGFVISLLFWTFFIRPFYDIHVSFIQNFEITMWFTVLSISRSYFMRRFFNAGLHKAIHKFVTELKT